MAVIILAVDYSMMTEEQLALISEYCENDMKKLKPICYFVWGKKGIPTCFHDDLYDDDVCDDDKLYFEDFGLNVNKVNEYDEDDYPRERFDKEQERQKRDE